MISEVIEMPEGATISVASGFDIQMWSENITFGVLKESDKIRKLTCRGFETMYLVMDKPGTYKFKSYLLENKVEKKKAQNLGQAHAIPWSLIISIGIGGVAYLVALGMFAPSICLKMCKCSKKTDRVAEAKMQDLKLQQGIDNAV